MLALALLLNERWSSRSQCLIHCPLVYFGRLFVETGGLISYGPSLIDNYRRAAGYVDRILKGEKPADLPVQAPTKYETGDQSQNRKGSGARQARAGLRARRACHRRWNAYGRRLPSHTRGGSRMRESRTCGSVRGARGNSRPYRCKTARVHRGARWHGSLAAGGASAAAGQGRADRVSGRCVGVRLRTPGRGIPLGSARPQLHRRQQHRHRVPLGGGEVRADSPELAASLVRSNVDVIVTHGTPGTLAARRATTTVPIVVASIGDPIATGVIASVARPGGNITGLSWFGPQLEAKRVELLKDVKPRLVEVAYPDAEPARNANVHQRLRLRLQD